VTSHETDVLVIGSGIAGLSFALKAAHDAHVAVITKKERARSNTNYAQGGIAAVFGSDDEFDLHVRDTLLAGAGLCHYGAVVELVREGPARIRELVEWGARFTRTGKDFSLGREGGHSRRRIVHAADLTGREIERALVSALAEHPRVTVFEDHLAVDLLTGLDPQTKARHCAGAIALDRRSNTLVQFQARFTLLATGGLGQAYRHTTNPDIATGDGVAMAYRAGVEVANLEFVQFHPTALYPAEERAVLISEAVRGEGAVLRTMRGAPLMGGHPLGSLATRDIVARTIDHQLKESGDSHVLLDLSPIPRETIETHFPYISRECEARGIDIRSEPIPVVPAAHYSCGGVRTDEYGKTSLAGLFAAGEVACTGVHGANRLASNSLLEALVYSHKAYGRLSLELRRPMPEVSETARTMGSTATPYVPIDVGAERAALRSLMWDNAGILRSDARLEGAERQLRGMQARVGGAFAPGALDAGLLELRNLCEVALLIVQSATSRRESRGLHYNVDHPYRDNEHFLRDTSMVTEVI
jgi:L-aspartate oxidase